ncbi:MAG: chromate transporter [Chloroflexi bacterium]|nr:chromate transporter [Chloroflexota bacterium]
MGPLEIFLTFLKASLFSTGGLGSLPSLHQDLTTNNIATDQDFGQAIAISQVSPGPTGLWVVALGYLTYGFLGAVLALVAVTIPPFLVLALSAGYSRIEHRPLVQGIIRGVSLAVVGLLLVVVWSVLSGPAIGWRGVAIALGAFALAYAARVNIVIVLALAALSGFILYS